MNMGKFIVIEGTDGSGKATQTKLLVENLKKEGVRVKTIDFPRYYDNFFGEFIGECLRGDHGDFVNMDPKIASVLYAADRMESSRKIKKWLEDDFLVIADRYASSNQIHQGGKIKDEEKRKKFLLWLDKMEYDVFNIAKPDTIIFLSVDADVSSKLVKKESNQKTKKYLQGKKDQSEYDQNYLDNSIESAKFLIKNFKNWKKIECMKNKKLLSIESIQEKVLKVVSKEIEF